MTKEKAIRHFERYVNDDCYTIEHQDDCRMAIAAIREQEERERGCEYCNEDRDGYRKMIGAFSITNPFHGNVWNLETRHCKPRQIYFCPMCGRRLQQPQKGE